MRFITPDMFKTGIVYQQPLIKKNINITAFAQSYQINTMMTSQVQQWFDVENHNFSIIYRTCQLEVNHQNMPFWEEITRIETTFCGMFYDIPVTALAKKYKSARNVEDMFSPRAEIHKVKDMPKSTPLGSIVAVTLEEGKNTSKPYEIKSYHVIDCSELYDV